MPPKNPPPHSALWHLIVKIFRHSIVPPPHLRLSIEDYRKVRALNATMILFGASLLLFITPLYVIFTHVGAVQERLLVNSTMILVLMGTYVLVRRGMWRVALWLIVMSQLGLSWAYGIHTQITEPLNYFVLIMGWAMFFLPMRPWLALMAVNLLLIMFYIPLVVWVDMEVIVKGAIVFNVLGYSILIVGNAYYQRTMRSYVRSLEDTSAWLSQTLETSTDGYYLMQAVFDDAGQVCDFRILQVNSAACNQMNMTREQLVGGLVCELFPVNREGGFFAQYKQVYETGIPLKQEYYIPEEQPGSGWYYQQVVRVQDGVVMMNRDITERKRYEIDLVQRQNRLQSLIESQSTYLVRIDIEGKYTFVNPSFARDFGFLGDVIGMTVLDTVHPDDGEAVANATLACIASPGHPVSVSIRKPKSDGTYFWTDWEFLAIADMDGNVSEIQCVGFDATERIEAEKNRLDAETLRIALSKQAELNQIKTRMMTRISHEFRTPLAIMRSSANMLERYYERMTPEKRQEKFDNINAEIDTLTEMLNDMSRILQGQNQTEVIRTRIDIPNTLRDLIARYQRLDNGKKRVYTLEIADDVGVVMLDVGQLDIILSNLMSNAIKFSAPDSTIHLQVRQENTTLVLSIADTGIGILPNDQPHLFDPFFRGSNFGEVPGIGLGLTLVKTAVDALGGQIVVESTPNIGTTVTVRLPTESPSAG